MDKVTLLGIPVHSVTMDEALAEIERLIALGKPAYVVTPNVDLLVKLQTDEEFRRVYESASLVVPDGMPLVWAAKYLGTPLKAKVSGSDLFVEFCKVAAKKGYKIYLLGAGPGVAAKAAEVMQACYPGIRVVGTYSPSFGFEKKPEECEMIIQKIREAKPDLLFVGLGAPKQDKFAFRYKERYGVPVSIGVGASIDFMAGQVKRAPLWMQNSGLEWFWRLMMEPTRLWKRYLADDPIFFWYLLKQKLSQGRPPQQ